MGEPKNSPSCSRLISQHERPNVSAFKRNPGNPNKIRPVRTSNWSESAFVQAAEENNWMVAKRGWPDFICWRNGELICVEVKPKAKSRLKFPQGIVMKLLAKAGIRCYMWNPESGFTRIYPHTENQSNRSCRSTARPVRATGRIRENAMVDRAQALPVATGPVTTA